MKSATFVRKLPNFRGDARLYVLDPPVLYDDDLRTRYVVVSAANVPSSGPETYIFRANDRGEVLDWTELDGSFRGALDHRKALELAGYAIA